ncbi:hypothetical protein J7K41_00030 [Candidatus Micrarchaeota archaeon]|nr:hypothetical protein [Candidatus Micrarchaeota archaeon]
MGILTCERCGEQVYKVERCDYCGRLICHSCVKSSRKTKDGRRVICKDCWTDTQKRKAYKRD